MTEQAFLHQLKQMPDSMKQELLAFMDYLFFKYKSTLPSQPQKENDKSPKKPLKAGFLKGTFKLSHDFDEPLDDFKGYMQ